MNSAVREVFDYLVTAGLAEKRGRLHSLTPLGTSISRKLNIEGKGYSFFQNLYTKVKLEKEKGMSIRTDSKPQHPVDAETLNRTWLREMREEIEAAKGDILAEAKEEAKREALKVVAPLLRELRDLQESESEEDSHARAKRNENVVESAMPERFFVDSQELYDRAKETGQLDRKLTAGGVNNVARRLVAQKRAVMEKRSGRNIFRRVPNAMSISSESE